jgi:hypothetical protein
MAFMTTRRTAAIRLCALASIVWPASAQKTPLERALEYVISARGSLASPKPGSHQAKALSLIGEVIKELQAGPPCQH